MKRLDFNKPGVFDEWRRLYNSLTDEEQSEFYDDLERFYPHQQSFTKPNYDELIKRYPRAIVLEVGGWKGELASYCMSMSGAPMWWLNIELSQRAIDQTVPGLVNFVAVKPKRFNWFKKHRGGAGMFNIAIASHVIEHLKDKDLLYLLNCLSDIKVVALEAPIDDGPSDWTGYHGSHILKMGWNGIDKAMKKRGFSSERVNAHFRIYTRG